MEKRKALESANASHACARGIEDVWSDFRSGGLDPRHRENTWGESSPCCDRDSWLCFADGRERRALLELFHGREVAGCGTCGSGFDPGKCEPTGEVEEILVARKVLGTRAADSDLRRRPGADHPLFCDQARSPGDCGPWPFP